MKTRTATSAGFAAIWTLLCAVLLALLIFDLLPHFELLTQPARGDALREASNAITACSRFLGVALSMLVALCALAIPLTANVYTPKLIELFVADRLNRLVIGYFVLANAVVLWNDVMLGLSGAEVAARPRALVCVALTLVALLSIAPYLLYVLRFLVPQSIVGRIQREVVASIDDLGDETDPAEQDQALRRAVTNIQYLGKVTLRSIQRHDRDVAAEGLQALEEVFQAYQTRKPYLSPSALRSSCRDALGLGPELSLEIERKQAVIEVAILAELNLLLPVAIRVEVGEVVAQIAALTRHLGLRVAERGDAGAADMVTLYFNTFLRHALKTRSPDSFYKLVYQYRRFAENVLESAPQLSERVAFFLDYYAHQAVRMGMPYLLNVVAYDLAALCEAAYERKVHCRKRLLDLFIALDRDEPGILDMPGMVKAQIILSAKLATTGVEDAAGLLESELRKVPEEVLRETFGQIIAAREENFWEIADRRRHLDHVEPAYRKAVRDLRKRLTGVDEAGVATMLFMEEARKEAQLAARKGTREAPRPTPRGPKPAAPQEPPSEAEREEAPAESSGSGRRERSEPSPPPPSSLPPRRA